jgi:hypothetical protein
MLQMNPPIEKDGRSSKPTRRFVAAFVASAALALSSTASAAPTPKDCATASEDALSLKKQEKLGSARDRLLVCSDPVCPAEVRDECARRMSEVTAAIPSVVFDVKDAGGNDASAVRVTMDGAPLVDHVGAAAVSVDPGEHVFRFESASAPAVEKRFVVREGEKNRHLEVTLGGAAPGAAPSSTAAEGTSSAPPPATSGAPERREASSWSDNKTFALVAAGVGVIGIGVGAGFGLSAFGKWSTAQSQCGSACGPNDAAQATKSDAQSAATISTVAFVVGAVGIAGGAILWFTAPSGAQVQVTPTYGAGSAGLTVRGAF